MFDNPMIVSALIAAMVSISIAGTSGLYVIIKSRQEINILKNKIVAESHSKRFLKEAATYRKLFKDFNDERRVMHAELDSIGEGADGTKILQHVLNFYGVTKDYYQDNSPFLKTQEIEEGFLVIQGIIDSGILNDHTNANKMDNVQKVFTKCIHLFEKMHKKSVS